MPLRPTVTQRALAAGIAAAGLLIGAFAAGAARCDAAAVPGGNATRVDGGSLNLNDTSSLLAAARAKAAADARTKAAQYARALGMSLGPVVSVSEQHPAPMPPVFAAPSAAGAAPSPVPV